MESGKANMKLDYTKTLNLPSTDFPMRANLPEKEKVILDKWDKNHIYEELKENNKDLPIYTLHDGPPYANGAIHMGHALNKVLKDFVVRYKNMSGYSALFIPGWDTHGLPTELKAMKKIKNKSGISPVELRNICKEFVDRYILEQKEDFKRLGVIADWERPYITLQNEYESAELEVFAKMVDKGCIYRGLKPVYWCSSCRTALAEAEIEYQKDLCKSIYVKFRISKDNGVFNKLNIEPSKVNFLIWTTTTWTLPANTAICLNKKFVYVLVKYADEYYVVAKNLLESVMNQANISPEDYEIISEIKGEDFEYIKVKHPFLNRESLVILGDHVTLESGTGCVHTAPGHGLEDFSVCQNYDELKDLKNILVAVDNKGCMTDICGEKIFGLNIDEANETIFKELEKSGRLFAVNEYTHSYPHCWRCKKPIIFRATKQWFCSVDAFKEKAILESENVNWYPSWGKERMKSMITERKDWCISRQRRWGVPIPAFYCRECGGVLLSKDIILHVASVVKEYGTDVWYQKDEKDLLPENTTCTKCGSKSFVKEMDILDVWFDSGTSHTAVCKERDEIKFPADLYLEGADQYRGWFQSSLLTSVAAYGVSPYKNVVTHGLVVDGEGRKQSKSLGNGISPQEIINKYGADVLRLWVAASDYHSDVKLSSEVLKQIAESYRKIRNTARFILGNLQDFNISLDFLDLENLENLDKWVLYKLNSVIRESLSGYETFEFSKVYRSIYTFCVVELSNYYLDVIKDRLYVQAKDSRVRRSAQTAIYLILSALVKLIAPILPFTADEIFNHILHSNLENEKNVLFNRMPKELNLCFSDDFLDTWCKINRIREKVIREIEKLRSEKVLGSSLEARVCFYCKDESDYNFLESVKKDLTEVLIVSNIEIFKESDIEKYFEILPGIGVKVLRANGSKCARCWCYSEYVNETEGKYICEKCEEVLKRND